MSADVRNEFINIGTNNSEILRRESADSAPADLPAATATTAATAIVLPSAMQTQTQIQQAPFIFKRPHFCLIRKNKSKIDELITLILNLPQLTAFERFILRTRYIELLITFRRRCFYYSLLHRTFRLIVTIGSLIVPALLSVQYDTTYKTQIYWVTWIISLAVTTANGLFTLFKIDKKYHFIHTITELLWSEGWQYFALTGRYGAAGHLLPAGVPHTHNAMFPYFCHYVEKIKMKQIEEEYYKGVETDQNSIIIQSRSQVQTQGQQLPPVVPNQGVSKLYPFTPDKNIVKTAENIPAATRSEIEKFLENMQLGQQGSAQENPMIK